MTLEQAMESVEEVFSFDYVGDSMMAVRKDPDNKALQEQLAGELLEALVSQTGDASEESRAVFAEAAKARVQQYVKSAKSARGTGCGK